MILEIIAALFLMPFIVALFLIPLWKIFQKAGLNPAKSLLIFIPGVGFLIATYVLAFSRWGTEKKRKP